MSNTNDEKYFIHILLLHVIYGIGCNIIDILYIIYIIYTPCNFMQFQHFQDIIFKFVRQKQ